ncbi:haloacid dehalogenase-like hydrolase domain-containing protein 3 isoform X2 [Pundamilia nyererei]|uniref:Haloacid dehalogenase-like hydrolase domain-containing protein 3 isoform X2 n=1 Tax=Pundamilia nyererei TaxID=303518 RepID=A0A9Y3V7C0_9CICH|nr:PREDICTED: haloacid dehalogenase-like hydrolase domain-containing protein 3 isoform X2 [Pundamilia nyererei]
MCHPLATFTIITPWCDASSSALGAMGCEGHPAEGALICGRAVLQGGRAYGLEPQSCGGRRCFPVFPDSKKALESCSSLGLKLGVVSNFDNRLEAILHVCGLLSYFSFLITSEEAGVAKPSPAIFSQALQKCGVPADRVAHIGDHYVNDYLTSRSMGIHGFLLDRHKDGQLDVPREHRLISLDELPSRLQQHMN